MKAINFDHAATTSPEQAVVDAICRTMTQCDANPSSAYSDVGAPRKEIRKAKATLAEMLNCTAQEIYYTSGGTEANNWALHQAQGRHVVLSSIEHKSVLLAAKNQECDITLVPVSSDCVVRADDVLAAIRSDTALVSVQLANNETGVLQPIAEIGAITRKKGILFHCDAVAAFGHVPIDVKDCNIDMLSSSAHKIYGPRGVGFLFIKEGITTRPLIAGVQEHGLRGGTENVPAISGFGVAAELADKDMQDRAKREHLLREMLVKSLNEQNPDIVELCANSARLPSIAAFCLPNIESEYAIAQLDLRGIRVSGGAACASQTGAPSHVLLAMGLQESAARRVIRISLGRYSTEHEVLAVAKAILEICLVKNIKA